MVIWGIRYRLFSCCGNTCSLTQFSNVRITCCCCFRPGNTDSPVDLMKLIKQTTEVFTNKSSAKHYKLPSRSGNTWIPGNFEEYIISCVLVVVIIDLAQRTHKAWNKRWRSQVHSAPPARGKNKSLKAPEASDATPSLYGALFWDWTKLNHYSNHPITLKSPEATHYGPSLPPSSLISRCFLSEPPTWFLCEGAN